MRRHIVDDAISDTRQQLDEENTVNVNDERDILPALNRAQDSCADILAKHYESPLLTYTTVTLTGGTSEYDIPKDAFQARIEKVEVQVNGTFFPVKAISYRDLSSYEIQNSVNIPYYFATLGQEFKLVPTPNGTYPLRVWYLKSPDSLVKQQGRITNINVASNYLIVDDIGSDLTVEDSDLNNYVNIWDGANGTLKASLQIQSIVGNKITFKTVPDRTTVLGKTISTSIPTTIALDDYVSVVSGTCVPFLKQPWFNYVVQHAVASLTRKLGGAADMEVRILDDLEKVVKSSWSGRENTARVSKRNKNYFMMGRRNYYTR